MLRQPARDPPRRSCDILCKMNAFHAQSIEEVLRQVRTVPDGLSTEEAKRRLAEFGPNELPAPPKPSVLRVFLNEFRSMFVYVLLAAGALSFGIGKTTDASVILVIVIANAIIGFLQRRKAERAIEALQQMLVETAKVYRDGELVKILSRELVTGDVISIEEGDRIPADARLLKEENLRTDESALTGESFPEDKSLEVREEATPLADQANMVYMGTMAVAGEGRAVVVATGFHTAFGRIAASMRDIRGERTHFEKRVDQLALQMGIFATVGALTTFAVGFFIRGLAFFDILLFSVASLVSGIPEGLPAVVAIVLAAGAWRMARKNAVVRRLAAVETLGVATVIVTDKTGTLTQNSMTIEEILLAKSSTFTVSGKGWEPRGAFFYGGQMIQPLEIQELRHLIEIGTIVNTAKLVRAEKHYEVIGDPTEAAFIVLGEKAGVSGTPATFVNGRLISGAVPFEQFRAIIEEELAK